MFNLNSESSTESTTVRVPLLILPLRISISLARKLKGLGKILSRFTPGLEYDLESAGLELSEAEYISVSLVNCIIYFLLFFALLFSMLFFVQEKNLGLALSSSAGYSAVIFVLILYALLKYPRILAEKKAEMVDKHLLFALKDLKLQIASGITLYNAMVNVSKAGYGYASKEFENVVRDVNTGTPIDKALEKMALDSKSAFLRRTTWQLVNTLKAGASLEGALETLIRDLTADQRDRIKKFTSELNLWILMYMLFAVAVPTLGITLLIILSSFAGFGISKGLFITFIVLCFIVQIILIGFITTRRPVVVM